MMDVKRTFCDIPLEEEVGDFFLLQLSRGLAGDVKKKIIFGIGPANNGKSTFVEACQLSFGDYVGNFNAETLSFRDSYQNRRSCKHALGLAASIQTAHFFQRTQKQIGSGWKFYEENF